MTIDVSPQYSMERATEYNIISMMEQLKRYEDEHGFLSKILFYNAVFFTSIFFLCLFPTKIYSEIISRVLNISFRLKGAIFRLYHVALIATCFLGILLVVFKLQTEQYTKNLALDTPEKRLYRLKYKWLMEEQIWLLTLVFTEICAIFKIAGLYDREKIAKTELANIQYLKDKRDKDELIRSENLPTQASVENEYVNTTD
jgi:hypothetical protein